MAEQLLTDTTALRRSPLAHLALQMHEQTVTGERGVALREIPFLTMVGIRVAPGTPAAESVAAAAGMPLPTGHGRVTGTAGAVLLGPRIGKFAHDGKPNAIPGHNMGMATLGTLTNVDAFVGLDTAADRVAAESLRQRGPAGIGHDVRRGDGLVHGGGDNAVFIQRIDAFGGNSFIRQFLLHPFVPQHFLLVHFPAMAGVDQHQLFACRYAIQQVLQGYRALALNRRLRLHDREVREGRVTFEHEWIVRVEALIELRVQQGLLSLFGHDGSRSFLTVGKVTRAGGPRCGTGRSRGRRS